MIVLVDDERSSCRLITGLLEGAGYSVRSFLDASAALAFLDDHEPELILSDVIMPGVSGFELRARYAQRHPGRATPFVFLSVLSDATSIVEGLDLGADDFLGKPVDARLLLARVAALLNR